MTPGILAMVLFAVLSAVRDVLAKERFSQQSVSPVFFVWYGCTIAAVLFYLRASLRVGRPYAFQDFRKASRPIQRRFVATNVMTLVAFVTTFLAIERLNAFSNALIDYGAAPIVTATLAVWMRGERLSARAIAGMLVSIAGMVILLSGMRGSQGSEVGPQLTGVLYAVASCVALAMAMVWNKDFVDYGIMRERVIVTRLPLCVVALGAWCLATDGFPPASVWAGQAVLALLGFAGPLLLIVYAFESLQVKHVAIAQFMVPVLSFYGSLAFGRLTGNVASGIVAGCVVLFGVAWSEWWSRPKRPRALATSSSPA